MPCVQNKFLISHAFYIRLPIAAVTAAAGATALFNNLVPAFKEGVTNFSGGMALVGEVGPEVVTLGRGSNVIPNNKLGGLGGNVYITINAHPTNSPVEIAAEVKKLLDNNSRLTSRLI